MTQADDNFDAAVTANSQRRSALRRRALFGGKIIFNHQSSVLSCTVRNLSESGACLEFGAMLGVPDQFELVVEGAGIRADYRVVWRRGRRVGVLRI